MGITVKEVSAPEQKSVQEVEKELLEKHESQFVDPEVSTTETVAEKVEAPKSQETPAVEEVSEKKELADEDVLSYIGKRYGKTIESLDQLFEEREKSEELPEDVSAYFKYKKDTGRGIDDFVKLQQNYDEMDQDDLLASYYKAKEDYLDNDDIAAILSDFEFDEDLDEEKEIKKKKRAKKKVVSEALSFFNEQKEQYKIPLESRAESLNPEVEKELKDYRESLQRAKTSEEESALRRKKFIERTNSLLDDNFEGFNFKIGENSYSYKPSNLEELKEKNSDISTFITAFLDENGELTDVERYHKSLAIANYPDRFAKFFYEQGRAEAVTNSAKKSKNIDFDQRRVPEVSNKGGLQIKNVTQVSDGNRLRIRKRK